MNNDFTTACSTGLKAGIHRGKAEGRTASPEAIRDLQLNISSLENILISS